MPARGPQPALGLREEAHAAGAEPGRVIAGASASKGCRAAALGWGRSALS